MKKLLFFSFVMFMAGAAFAQIPTSLQGKYRGFKQAGNKIDITTTVLVQQAQILFKGQHEMALNIEKTPEAGIYKIKMVDKNEWRYMKLYSEKGILHMVWYALCDGRSIDEEFKFKKEI